MSLAFADIALLVIDIDGTLTDAKLIWAGPELGWTQVYSVRDGESIRRLCKRGIPVVPLSRNATLCARTRMEGLGLPLDWLGVSDKVAAFDEVQKRYGVVPERIAYVGDGREDVPVFKLVGFPIAVANAHKSAIEAARHVTKARGGEHAMEEVIDLILEAHGWAS
jgi:3-deoxy-D-manno-octulosonate 8-phosphate phosphatase (KDO 8-P phosphatase)